MFWPTTNKNISCGFNPRQRQNNKKGKKLVVANIEIQYNTAVRGEGRSPEIDHCRYRKIKEAR